MVRGWAVERRQSLLLFNSVSANTDFGDETLHGNDSKIKGVKEAKGSAALGAFYLDRVQSRQRRGLDIQG